MALNWTTLNDSRQPVPLNEDELFIMTIDKGAEVTLISGGSATKQSLRETGKLYLTDKRLIFVQTTASSNAPLDSLTIPLLSILSTSFVQPTFSNNYLTMDIKPTQGGGLTEGTKVEIRLKDQGMFSFVNSLEKTRERLLFMRRQSSLEDELPVYDPPAAGPSGSSSQGPSPSFVGDRGSVPDDAPPGYEA